jgi:hypothetical protein
MQLRVKIGDASINCSGKLGKFWENFPRLQTHTKIWHSYRHTLSKREKSSYLKAEQCLMKLPAKLGYPGTRTRFDELQAAHAMGGEVVHEVVSRHIVVVPWDRMPTR